MASCERAASLSSKERRMAHYVEADCLKLWGRYEEARQALLQARRARGHPVPRAERQSQAILALDQACLEAEVNRPEEALAFLRESEELLQDDPRLSLWCLATRTWIVAVLGGKDEAVRRIEEIEARKERFANDRRTLQVCCQMLSRATYALGKYPWSIAYLQQCLALPPDPVFCPFIYYSLGECYTILGREDAARAHYAEAVNQGLDLYYSRLALQRMQELGG